jgi:DNA primase large subunit
MRHLHDSLKQNHHLRHYGRLQYGLFLKGIGLPMEESLRFFKNEFSKGTIPLDKASVLFTISFERFRS